MKNILLILILSICSFSFAQEVKKKRDLYLNLAANYNYNSYIYGFCPKFSPAVSLLIRPKTNRIWELGIAQVYFKRRESTSSIHKYACNSLNFNHYWVFLTENDFPLKPILGAGIVAYYTNKRLETKNALLQYPYQFQNWVIEPNVSIGGLYALNEKWLMTLTNSVRFWGLCYFRNYVENPSLSFEQSVNRGFDTTFDFGLMNLRLSIARKF